jgi:UDPglucose 6-dehydrogenase
LGADVREVAQGMGYDKRIGMNFLEAGLGWGGSCFPKDVKALAHMAVLNGTHPQLLQAVMEINRNQRRRVVLKLRKALNGNLSDKEIGVLGLSFKENTDDTRESPAFEVIHLLENEGAKVRAYDPQAMQNAAKELTHIQLCSDPYQVATGADALILATKWNEFKQLDFKRIRQLMRTPILMDGRYQWDAKYLSSLGFIYFGIGQGNHIELK